MIGKQETLTTRHETNPLFFVSSRSSQIILFTWLTGLSLSIRIPGRSRLRHHRKCSRSSALVRTRRDWRIRSRRRPSWVAQWSPAIDPQVPFARRCRKPVGRTKVSRSWVARSLGSRTASAFDSSAWGVLWHGSTWACASTEFFAFAPRTNSRWSITRAPSTRAFDLASLFKSF